MTDTDQKTGQLKTCNKCSEVKPIREFGSIKNRKGERVPSYHCKACEVERTRVKRSKPGYREKERENNRQYAADKRANDPEYVTKKNEANRIYASKRREDPEHRAAVNLLRRVLWLTDEEYREKTNTRARQWISENMDRWHAALSNRRALVRGAEGSFTPEDVESIHASQNYKCVYCGTPTAESHHIDHKHPIVRGGSNWPENLQILCPSCNCSKRDKTHEEFLQMRSETALALTNL